MSFAYLPWYTGDYLRDTRHLSPMKHGVYLLLLAHCWDQKGPVPLDEQEAAGIANCRSIDEVEALRYILDRYFVRMDDGHYNKRMQAEIARAESISVKREDAGRRGANERMRRFREAQAIAKQELSNCQASAKQVTLSPSPSPSLNQKNQKAVGDRSTEKQTARASRLALDAVPADWIEFCKKTRPDLSPDSTWERFRDYWSAVPGARGRKLDWAATWRNWVRNERAGRKDANPSDIAALIEQLEREGK